MPSSTATLALLLPSFLIAACATTMKPPAANGGPALSSAGVQVALLRQGCAQAQESDEWGWDLVEESVEIEVRNGAAQPATVHRDRFRLIAPDGSALATSTWGAAEALTVPGGAAQTFALRFMTRGGLDCAQPMRLDPDGGITLPETTVAFQPVSFLPTRGL
ncbi:MAG TPA: hypothetical protein VIF57_29960 [Polyangia bacterium]